jgi:hypothetical protein
MGGGRGGSNIWLPCLSLSLTMVFLLYLSLSCVIGYCSVLHFLSLSWLPYHILWYRVSYPWLAYGSLDYRIFAIALGENLVRTGLHFAWFLLFICYWIVWFCFICLIWSVALGENLVRTWLDFAWFLLLNGLILLDVGRRFRRKPRSDLGSFCMIFAIFFAIALLDFACLAVVVSCHCIAWLAVVSYCSVLYSLSLYGIVVCCVSYPWLACGSLDYCIPGRNLVHTLLDFAWFLCNLKRSFGRKSRSDWAWFCLIFV